MDLADDDPAGVTSVMLAAKFEENEYLKSKSCSVQETSCGTNSAEFASVEDWR